MWYELTGSVKRWAAVSGTLTLPAGARVLQIKFSGGTCVLPTGDGTTTQTITCPSGIWFDLQENHLGFIMGVAGGTGSQLAIVFAGGAAAFVEYIGVPGVA
jgi:hypothetical protein